MIKKISIIISSIALASNFVMMPTNLYAQDYKQPPVVKSKELCKNNGNIYYMHRVLPKQTLFSICKAYGVTIEEVNAANPGLNLKSDGLKKDQILFIPATTGSKKDAKFATREVAKKEAKKETEQSKSNEVQKTNTREYHGGFVTEEGKTTDTASSNTHTSTPTQHQTSNETQRQQNGINNENFDYFIHKVKWYEDLNRISKKYGISKELIMRFNQMPTEKVVRKQKLKIPTNPEAVKEALKLADLGSNEKKSDNIENLKNKIDAIAQNNINTIEEWFSSEEEKITGNITAKAVLMLPFNAEIEGNANKNYLDFYAGALLATKDLSDKKISTDLCVYDVFGPSLKVTESRLNKSDVIIGPVSLSKIEEALSICPNNTNIISPLDPNVAKLASTYSNFIQAPASKYSQYRDMVKWVKEESKIGDKTIVFSEKNRAPGAYENSLKLNMENLNVEYSEFSYGILQGRNIQTSLENLFSKESTNRILIASENEAFVNDVIRNLGLLQYKEYNVVLYAPGKFRNFETLNVENLHNLNMRMSSGYSIDYDNEKVKNFLASYRALYNTEPSQFAFQGYDVTYYFISHFARYGNDPLSFENCIRESLLQSDFKFVRAENGGLINTAIRRLVYNKDMSVSYLLIRD